MHIRRMQPDDAMGVARLAGELGAHRDAGLRMHLGDRRHGAWVAEQAGRIIGWLRVAHRPTLIAQSHVEVAWLVVDGAYQGRGIGAALLAAAEASASVGESKISPSATSSVDEDEAVDEVVRATG